jgi:hypothetical protein
MIESPVLDQRRRFLDSEDNTLHIGVEDLVIVLLGDLCDWNESESEGSGGPNLHFREGRFSHNPADGTHFV